MANYLTEGGYNKRPLWQWVVIYLVVAAVVYGLIYYFFLAKKVTGTNSLPSVGSNSIY